MEPFVGEIRIFGCNYAPIGWAFCNGAILPVQAYSTLSAVIGTRFGGDGTTTVGLPSMNGNAPIGRGQGPGLSPRNVGDKVGLSNVTLGLNEIPAHQHTFEGKANVATAANTASPAQSYVAEATGKELYTSVPKSGATEHIVLAPAGGTQPHNNMQPYLAMNFCIATEGIFPVRGDGGSPVEAYVGEIKMFAGDYAPMGWAFCDGKEMSISENETLYTLLGTTFGGNGQTTFMLPDLRGRLPIGLGQSPGQPNYTLGQRAGAETTTILSTQLPTHTHLTPESAGGKRIKYGNASASGDSGSPLGRHAAIVPGLKQYGKTASTNKTGAFTKGVTALAGATLPHENMQPSLAVSFIICLYGIFPSQF